MTTAQQARAEPGYESGGDVLAKLGVGAAVSYDDNALLGRRGQFLNSAESRQGGESDLATRQLVDLELTRRVGRLDSVSIGSRFDLAYLRTLRELRGYDLVGSARFAKSLGFWATVTPELEARYHREAPEWSYRTLSPRVRADVTFEPGLITAFEYSYTTQQFARTESGEAQPKNSYGNIDNTRHRAFFELKLWPTESVRPSLAYDIEFSRYAGNLKGNLADYSGLAGRERSDITGGATGRVLIRLLERLIITPGVRAEVNRSNSDPFRYNAAHALLDVMWNPAAAHAVLLRADSSRVDFPDERFDRRFSNKRRDYRADLAALYELRLTKATTIQLVFKRLQNDSNDCKNFDPQRDELGLPVYSRSYSCYSQNRVELSVRHVFEGDWP